MQYTSLYIASRKLKRVEPDLFDFVELLRRLKSAGSGDVPGRPIAGCPIHVETDYPKVKTAQLSGLALGV